MITSRTAVVALAVTSVSAAVLAGCSSDSGSSNGSGKIAFIQGVSGDEFYISMQCGIEAAAKSAGITVDTQGPAKFDPTLQKPIVDSVVASHPSAILIAPTDVAAMQAPLAAAAKAGIKVVLVDTTVQDPSIAVSAISSDNVGGGAEAFKAIESLNPNGGKILVISTDPGISTVDARVQGFKDAAAKNPSFDYLGVQYSHNDPAEAAKLVSAALSKDPDIVGVFATNTFAAEGTATGVRQANKQDQVKIVGFDAGPAQVKQLREGTVQALIAQQPDTIGTDGIEQAVNALNNRPVTKDISTGFHMITADNIDGEGADYIYKSSC
ncbi:ABC transporter substrate-binding protein [Mycolicibacterium sp. P9-22]|uniref:ABC transporter substrate-binding protein n=1 Tax=Mycolicibacterium sp. P9-22 TaxID=2024613 RepID=UPI0011F02EB6|nr:ABC transporter substrate-binding protein [Mycolicibacterium sp. P9-22]KAA0113039.1 ribose ABC transporter substrate-binding protein [Mycolicibacterium sp. P9-22]